MKDTNVFHTTFAFRNVYSAIRLRNHSHLRTLTQAQHIPSESRTCGAEYVENVLKSLKILHQIKQQHILKMLMDNEIKTLVIMLY